MFVRHIIKIKQGQYGKKMSKKYPEVTISNTENRTLFSSKIGQEFRVSVAFPYNYSDSENNYPVVYVLDANATFGTVTEISRNLQMFKELPEMFIVGIDYPLSENRISAGIRFRDLTPSIDDEWLAENIEAYSEFFGIPLENSGTGGAEKFLQFLHNEMIPFVEANYRINPDDRTLLGYSLGGLFALYDLFHPSNTFYRYIIGSPSIWWDNKVSFSYEEKYAAENTNLAAAVFISVGSLEEPEDEPNESAMRTNMQKLVKVLEGREYKDLKLKIISLKGRLTHLAFLLQSVEG